MAAGPKILVVAAEELTLANVEEVRLSLVAGLGTDHELVVLDMSAVQMVTTPGLGLLLEIRREITARHGRLILASPGPMLVEVIHRTQLDRVFEVVDSVEAAKVKMGGLPTQGRAP